MDPITAIAISVDHPIVTALGVLIHNPITYIAMVLTLLFTGEKRTEKRKKILLSLAIAALVTFGIKNFMAYERPCVGEDWCPGSYSFPSMHTAIAFTMMVAFLNKKSYPVYVLFALLVGFSRLNIGVHIFQDIAAALPVGLLSYYVTHKLWEGMEK
jgi:undecaprenyl-diphosphatase